MRALLPLAGPHRVRHAASRLSAANASAEGVDEVKALYQSTVPPLLTACLAAFLFNAALLASARWVRRLSPTLRLSLSLAAADAFASALIGTGLVVNSLLPKVYGVMRFTKCFSLLLEAFRLGAVVVIVLHLLALAVNHYIGILRPLHYHATVTRRVAIATIAVVWILPVAFFLLYFSLVPGDGFQSPGCASNDFLLRVPFRATFSVLFLLPLLLMTLMYAHMFVLVRRSPSPLHRNVKAIFTTLLILGTYVLGWMPAVLFFALTCLDCPLPYTGIPLGVRVRVGIFVNAMVVLKSLVDPVIYVVRMPEIQAAMALVWRTRCGLVERSTDIPLHSRTDFNMSRKANANGVSPC